jgi:hypothetical protein
MVLAPELLEEGDIVLITIAADQKEGAGLRNYRNWRPLDGRGHLGSSIRSSTRHTMTGSCVDLEPGPAGMGR